METPIEDESQEFSTPYFRQLISRSQRTLAKVRRIDVAELLEWAWVDGQLEPFASRLVRSRPDLEGEVSRIMDELRQSQV